MLSVESDLLPSIPALTHDAAWRIDTIHQQHVPRRYTVDLVKVQSQSLDHYDGHKHQCRAHAGLPAWSKSWVVDQQTSVFSVKSCKLFSIKYHVVFS